MTAPNIVNVATITGKTAVQAVGTSATAIVTNSASSGKVLNDPMLLSLHAILNRDISLIWSNPNSSNFEMDVIALKTQHADTSCFDLPS